MTSPLTTALMPDDILSGFGAIGVDDDVIAVAMTTASRTVLLSFIVLKQTYYINTVWFDVTGS